MLAILCCGFALAEEAAVFTAPQVYPVERYETGWSKNPFTLKTAPVAVENAPFARDLAIGAYYGDTANPTIVIVNTKTNERISLKKGQPAANGMQLGHVTLGGSRKDITAAVTLGAETSEIRYNDSYLKQVAAAEVSKSPAVQQQLHQQQMRQPPGSPLRIPMPQPPVQPGQAAPPGTARVGGSSVLPGQQGAAPQPVLSQLGVPQPGTVALTVSPAANSTGGNPNLTVSIGTQPGTTPSTSLVSQAGNPNTSPVPVRRRLISPVVNESALPP
ncbi:hypothetical protein [Prosthecobacter sp.]|uniref:hypothetical protein n=1 Tax=Prosthecobacter sp. TaxID=1965333 RepID=UPI003904D301